MELFSESAAPQWVCKVVRDSTVIGYVVIDSFVGGRASGGVRMLADLDEAELRDAARAKTLKHSFFGLPRGGAKAGIYGNPEAPQSERLRLLKEFGQAIAPLLRARIFAPAPDMGTHNADIEYLRESAGVRVPRRERHTIQSGVYTALSVFVGIQRATRRMGLPLSDCRVAIEGFGKVGGSLARVVSEAGARVVAISTSQGALYNPKGLDVARLTELAAQFGSRLVEHYPDAERLDCAALLELPVEVLSPCARRHSIHSENVGRVAARIVCPGANNPVSPEAERALLARGVLSVPDFVANCGGALGATMEYAAIPPTRIAAVLEERLGARMDWVLQTAAEQNVSPREIAVAYALRRHAQIQHAAAHPTLRGALFEFGQEVYRHGWLPRALVAPLSRRYFERMIG